MKYNRCQRRADMPISATVMKGKDRHYPYGDKRLISVTSVLDRIPKPGLEKWKKWNIIEWMQNNPDRCQGKTAKQILSYYEKEDRSSISANTGTIAHEYLETGVRHDDTPSEVHPFLDQIDTFIEEYRPKIILSERTMYSLKWGYAGTADLVMEVGGKRYFADLKTGKAIWPEVGLQLSAYKGSDFFVEGEEEIPISDLGVEEDFGLVLHVRPDTYELRLVDIGSDVYNTFLSILDVYNWEIEQAGVVRGVVPIYE
jgi:hypothetical protein